MRNSERAELLGIVGGLICAIVLVMVALFYAGKATDLVAFFVLTAVAPVIAAALIENRHVGALAARYRRWHWPVNAALFTAVTIALVILSPYDAHLVLRSTAIDYLVTVDRFVLWIALGAAYVFAAVMVGRWETRRETKWPRRLALVLALVFVVSLYDDGHHTEFMHYIPYMGPALYAAAGGVPFSDVYSQYGLLPWVNIYAAFHVAPPGYGTAAIAVRLIHTIYLAIAVLVLYALARRPISALMLMVPVLLVSISYHVGFVNLNAYPSAGGMRYLPPALMALAAVRLPARHWMTIAVLILASFWSLESFLFAGSIWGGTLFFERLRHRQLREAAMDVATGTAAVIGSHLAFALAIFAVTDRRIDYLPYFEMFGVFVDTRPIWMLPQSGAFLWWLPVWFCVFAVLTLAISSAIRGERNRLVPVAIWTIGAAAYFAGRTNSTTLWMAAIPFGILIICMLQDL